MPLSHGLGYLPDVPRVDDLTSDHPEITNLIQRTNAGQLVEAGALLRRCRRKWTSPNGFRPYSTRDP